MRRFLTGVVLPAAAVALLLTRTGPARRAARAAREGFARFRRSSSPSVRLYDAASGLAMGGLYGTIADDLLREAPEARSILDIGCGPGRLLVEIADRFPEAVITGVDLDPAMVGLAARRVRSERLSDRVQLAVADAAVLPFPDKSFDLVASSFSVHHWGEERASMEEVARVLSSGGLACLYDVPGWFGRLEGNAGIDRAVAVAPFVDKRLDAFSGPRWLSVVKRARLR